MLKNLYKLGNLLIKNNRLLHVFDIDYNKEKYNVIFYRLPKAKKKYYTVELTFINTRDKNKYISCYANSHSMDISPVEFCNFFNIQFISGKANISSIFATFYKKFNSQVNLDIFSYLPEQQQIMKEYICHKEPTKERDKKYLYDFRRTGNRSKFNNDKAAYYYPEIYKYFANKTEYSFFFSPHKEDEVKDVNELLKKIKKSLFIIGNAFGVFGYFFKLLIMLS